MKKDLIPEAVAKKSPRGKRDLDIPADTGCLHNGIQGAQGDQLTPQMVIQVTPRIFRIYLKLSRAATSPSR